MIEVKPLKLIIFGLFFLFLTTLAFWFPRIVQAVGYGCPYNHCEVCQCVTVYCNIPYPIPPECEDECTGSIGEGEGYCCAPPSPTPTPSPTPPPPPTPTPSPKKDCNEGCWFSSECSTNYCYRPGGSFIFREGVCRNQSCSLEVDCLCPVTATPTPTPTAIPMKDCNEACLNRVECWVNYCYQGWCRNRDCPEETDCICPLKECNQSCKSGYECKTGYCYLKQWCRNSSCPDERTCECPKTKMCQFKGCTAVNGQCVSREFGPIPWEAPCPEDDCQNNNDCKNIKLCTWNKCACPNDYCYHFEDIAFDPDEECPVSNCDLPGPNDPKCTGCPTTKYECNRSDPDAPFCYKDDDGPYATLDSCEIECQPSVTPTPPSLAPGWFQTEGGDVHSNYDSNVGDSVSSQIPATADEPFFSIEFEGNTPGVVSGSNTDMSFGSGSVSTKGWRIDFYSGQLYTGVSLPRYDYNYFYNTLGLKDKVTDSDNPCPNGDDPGTGKRIYNCSSGFTVSGDWNLSDGDEIIVLVSGGDLSIEAEINVPTGAFLAFIAGGNIMISNSIGENIGDDEPLIDGVFIADGRISTGNSDKRLVASGIFVAYGGFDFSGRDLEDDNETTPAELFLYRPDFVINAPDELKKSAITWQEVAP